MTQLLDLGVFQECLDTYGASFQRWPEGLRKQAEDFLKISEEARTLYVQELKLDNEINPVADRMPPQELREKILKNITK